MDVQELRKVFETRGIKKVKVGGFDIDGILRGKYISLKKFFSSAEKGFGFCDVIFGWDMADQLYDNAEVTGWHSGYPDAHAKIDLTTFRVLPQEPDTACFLVDFFKSNQKHVHPACPRNLLKRAVARAETAGYRPKFGAEFEFWLFQEDSDSVHDKKFSGLSPLSRGMFGYSWVRAGQHADLIHEILDTMSSFGVSIEGLHTETGPTVWEAALEYTDAVEAADQAALFKTTLKQIVAGMGLSVTFMAKWSPDLPGSSGHLHQSLWDADGERNLFYDPTQHHGLSRIARNYIAGLVSLAPELTALYSPTINTYKRYVPGVWAPLTPSWGIDNRTCGSRVITGGSGTRVEFRQTASDINPHIAMATCLAAGLHGIEQGLQPPEPVEGDATADPEAETLPLTLEAATLALKESETARTLLGEPFIEHYVRTRDWEVREARKAVTDWELSRYFETV